MVDDDLISLNVNFINEKLNEEQRNCVRNALGCKNLAIIHGPPGTGKTSTLTEIILQFLEQNKKILVVSPSNIAVDTIAERLLEFIDEESEIVCRIGHPTRMLEQVTNIAVDSIIEKKTKIMEKINLIINSLKKNKEDVLSKREKIEELKKLRSDEVQSLYERVKIIMATTIGCGSQDLQKYLSNSNTYFDVVIIDESSQAKECECFVPILLGKKYGIIIYKFNF
jgi:DNA polymerase alpha-associated DNA helicase A